MGNSICRIGISGNGLTPSECWFEARPISNGFSILMFISEVTLQPKHVFKSTAPFKVKLFVDFLVKQNEVNLEGVDPIKDIEITGLGEEDVALLKASILLMSEPNLYEWFYSQSHESQKLLAEIIPLPDFNSLEFLQELKDAIFEVDPDSDLLRLLNKNGINHDSHGLQLLLDNLIVKSATISNSSKQREPGERQKKVAPFKDEIYLIASHFDDETRRIGGGISGSKPSKRTFIIRWLENYVVANCKMPKGKHNVEIPFLGGKVRLGVIDFSNPPNEHLSE